MHPQNNRYDRTKDAHCAGHRKDWKTLDAVCHSGYYRYDRIFTLQHGRQHFIGHGVGPMAISGLALTFPLMNLAAAFGSLVGVGAATLVSVKLGQKDYDTAQRVLGMYWC